MKNIYLPLLFVISFTSNAQLYVNDNTFIYVNDASLFVNQNIELKAASSNLYLRNDGQLLQGLPTTTGANKGLGALSVYQEGTSNNYTYNYWCSPIGSSDATASNSNFGITQLGIPSTNLDPRSFTTASTTTSSPYDGESSNGTLNIAKYWIWKYISGTGYSNWEHVQDATTIQPGQGFTMKGTLGTDTVVPFAGAAANNPGNSQRYDFRGKPNDGDICVSVGAGTMSLVGNPYPSAIDLDRFIDDHPTVIDGIIYFWEQNNNDNSSHVLINYRGGYGQYTKNVGYKPADINSYNADGTFNSQIQSNASAPIVTTRKFSPIGQGFMVKGKTGGGGNVCMKNSYRVFNKEGATNNSVFGRVSENNTSNNEDSDKYYGEILNVAGIDYTKVKKGYAPQIRLDIIANNERRIHTVLAFGEEFTDGFDYSADAYSLADAPTNFYFVLENQTREFSMSAAKFNIDKKYPIGFRSAQECNYKVKVTDILYDFDPQQNVFIHDKNTDIFYNIKTGEFNLTIPAGDIRDRFEITFKEDSTLTVNDNLAELFDIFQDNKGKNLVISNPKTLNLKSVYLFDIAGKAILNKKDLGNQSNYQFSTSSFSEGVYIVKLITQANEVLTKKVIIYNKK